MPYDAQKSKYQDPKYVRFLFRKLGYDPKTIDSLADKLRITQDPRTVIQRGAKAYYRTGPNEIYLDDPPANKSQMPSYQEDLLHETQHAGHAAQGIMPFEMYKKGKDGTVENFPGPPHILNASDEYAGQLNEKQLWNSMQDKLTTTQGDNLQRLGQEMGVSPEQIARIKNQIKNVYAPDIKRTGKLRKQFEEMERGL